MSVTLTAALFALSHYCTSSDRKDIVFLQISRRPKKLPSLFSLTTFPGRGHYLFQHVTPAYWFSVPVESIFRWTMRCCSLCVLCAQTGSTTLLTFFVALLSPHFTRRTSSSLPFSVQTWVASLGLNLFGAFSRNSASWISSQTPDPDSFGVKCFLLWLQLWLFRRSKLPVGYSVWN